MMRMIRTTVALPADLVEAADRAVREGKAASRNELIALALQHEIAASERTAIDAAFAEMAHDMESRETALSIADDFSRADWEAFRFAHPD